VNRYPTWGYVAIAIAIVIAFLYTLPNFFGELPAVQVSSAKATVKLDAAVMKRAEEALTKGGIPYTGASLDANTLRIRFTDTDTQLKGKDLIHTTLNPGASPTATPEEDANVNFVVALNLVPASPRWLGAINAMPMYLGLDLRGGVHFLLQVDMQAAITKRLESLAGDIRSQLRDKSIRHGGVTREGQTLRVRFRDAAQRDQARNVLLSNLPDLAYGERGDGEDLLIVATLKPEAVKRTQEFALKQNITTLHNRINELGVAEPIIQQQGAERIVIQLPGVQDVTRAKRLIGRTATLEIRMVAEEHMNPEALANAAKGQAPFGTEFYVERNGQPLLVRRQVVLTGDRLTDAQPGFDNQTNEPAVHLRLDGQGARIFQEVTRENVNKRMAILLIEKGKGEVITAPVIRSEIPGGRVQISGRMTTTEANDVALLLRAGSLAAPMEIIEEMTIGPTLGKENIAKGFDSVAWGFAAICLFMIVYYNLFGVFSAIALGVNLLLLVSILSMLQATLTLPGMAAMALALGMAIDSNVLINERVREELRGGASPQAAINTGYDRAWATILDSNVTTLIAGVALLAFGSGPVRGFAVVHCIGILTSMFSAVFFSRGLVNLWYGRKKKLKSVSIGTVWRPDADGAITKAE
jgi:preprotein translocase subunit SecD